MEFAHAYSISLWTPAEVETYCTHYDLVLGKLAPMSGRPGWEGALVTHEGRVVGRVNKHEGQVIIHFNVDEERRPWLWGE